MKTTQAVLEMKQQCAEYLAAAKIEFMAEAPVESVRIKPR